MLSFRGCSFVETKDNMLIRTHPYMTVLYSTREATLHDLPSFAGTVVRDLYRYVADLDLLVCGPQYWFYHGVDGNGVDGSPTAAGGQPQIMDGQKFTLEVALPVQGKIPTAVLPFFKHLPAFRCLSSRYEGPWEGIGAEYQRMLQYVSDKGLKLNGTYAESFLHIDFDDPANQITELLIGLC
jgi:effector-binding domain-containing protein